MGTLINRGGRKMIELTAYKTSDGQLFEVEKKAAEHQQDIIGELLDMLIADNSPNITRVDRWKILMGTLENKELKNIINSLYYALNHGTDEL
jgi:hypothetical protein